MWYALSAQVRIIMSGPNLEQVAAIEHNGGVLLSAGAGSGKTYVLVSHMVYLTQKYHDQLPHAESRNSELLIKGLKEYYRNIVMMTFTKLAAGEIKIRIVNKFNELTKTADEHLWECAIAASDSLSVTTIHGFCYKLIKQGYFANVSSSVAIIDFSEFKKSLNSIIDDWVTDKQALVQENLEMQYLMVRLDRVKETLASIFSDPSLRHQWIHSLKTDIMSEGNSAISEIIDIFDFNELFETRISLDEYQQFKGKTWFDLILQFENIKLGCSKNIDSFLVFHNFFSSFSRFPNKPTEKQNAGELLPYYEKIKSFRDFLKERAESFAAFLIDAPFLEGWENLFKDLLSYCESEYWKMNKVTFSDLEYLALTQLDQTAIVDKISMDYNYFIVDEFQDTSYVQFEILQKLVKCDYTKIFCVGDVKQAIYGFRGGELRVFNESKKVIPTKLSLVNNYRSCQEIIDFNNNFFKNIFAKGMNFEGLDRYGVEVEFQKFPENKENLGRVEPIRANILNIADVEDLKLSSESVDYMEACAICHRIKILKENYSLEKIAVLYKKLKPSTYLIELLIQAEVGFSAQVKIPFKDDPIVGIFKILIERSFNQNKSSSNTLALWMIKSYLNLLGVESSCLTEKLLLDFDKEIKIWGVYPAFVRFYYQLNLANSNFNNNLSYIKQICFLNNDQLGDIYNYINNIETDKYSLDFRYGKDSEQVVIQTAHASKGLQYANVIIGGIYNNARSVIDLPLFGKLPGSLRWNRSSELRKFYQTPTFFLEQEITKLKEFSESKRLLYVACTRAEKTLSWIELELPEKYKIQKNTWRAAFDAWDDFKSKELVYQNELTVELDIVINADILNDLKFAPPLFHRDPLGITEKIIQTPEPIYISELSVTKLSTIEVCPQRFYLEHICKLDVEQVKVVGSEIPEQKALSSSERGTLLHELISYAIENNWYVDSTKVNERDNELLAWAVSKLRKYENYSTYFSEKLIKFNLISYMVVGIPDLFIIPNDKMELPSLWDFKTGRRNEIKEMSYNFQLLAYAYALYHLSYISKENSINLILCYIDSKEIVEQTVSFLDVENYVQSSFNKLSDLTVKNISACSYCPYDMICHKS
jgi:ATP-dependent exoDNAse (exonuclease V) beta subunit